MLKKINESIFPDRKKKKNNLAPMYKGPFEVVEVKGTTVVIRDTVGRLKTIHLNN